MVELRGFEPLTPSMRTGISWVLLDVHDPDFGATVQVRALVVIRRQERSAGTFSNKKECDKAWQRAETKVAEDGPATLGAGGRRSRRTSSSGCPTT
jgi:hypothetical protein